MSDGQGFSVKDTADSVESAHTAGSMETEVRPPDPFRFRDLVWRMLPACLVLVGLLIAIYLNALYNPSFRLGEGPGNIKVVGDSGKVAQRIPALFADDVGHSLLRVDLSARLQQLLEISWVRKASVARVWPDRIMVTVTERDPVAFLRLPGSTRLYLIDRLGVILDLRDGNHSFPVLTGITQAMPSHERLARLGLYEQVMEVFDGTHSGLAEAVSEIDLADVENAVVLTRHRNEMVRLQMGNDHLAHRLGVFLRYIDAWRAEFGSVEAVDLRFEKQVGVRPREAVRREG